MANKGEPVFQVQNLAMFLDGSMLTIQVDLGKSAGETSGGNIKVASTNGNQTITGPNGPVRIGVNLFRKVEQKATAT